MLNWLFGRRRSAPPARLVDLEQRLDDVDVTLSWLRKSVKDLNARLATVGRQVRRDESLQDDQQDDAADDPRMMPPQRATGPTAHLATRFRGF